MPLGSIALRTVCFALLAAVASCAPKAPAPRARGTIAAKLSRAEQAALLLKGLLLTSAELGPELELARYGRANPACWTAETAPIKPRRRLAAIVRSGTVSPGAQLCYFEYVRRGTHDDVIVKVYILKSEEEAAAALAHPYLARKSRRLRAHGLAPVKRRKNIVYFVTASEANLARANGISIVVERKLRRLGW